MPVSDPQAQGTVETSNTTAGDGYRALRERLRVLDFELASVREQIAHVIGHSAERDRCQSTRKRGRPKTVSDVQPSEVAIAIKAAGGLHKAAELLGCGRSTLGRYQAGIRPMPPALFESLRRLAGAQPESSNTPQRQSAGAAEAPPSIHKSSPRAIGEMA